MTTPLVHMKNISIEFPGVKALDQANFTLKRHSPCPDWGERCWEVNVNESSLWCSFTF